LAVFFKLQDEAQVGVVTALDGRDHFLKGLESAVIDLGRKDETGRLAAQQFGQLELDFTVAAELPLIVDHHGDEAFVAGIIGEAAAVVFDEGEKLFRVLALDEVAAIVEAGIDC
jgi:hypothetical protein